MSTSLDSTGFRTDALGEVTPTGVVTLAKAATVAYAAATNDPIPAHATGALAPPVYAVAPAFASMTAALRSVAPEHLLGLLVHGEHEFRFARPLRPGESVRGASVPVGIRRRRSGVTVVVKALLWDSADMLVCEQWMTAFFRRPAGAGDLACGGFAGERGLADDALAAAVDAGETAPDHDCPASVWASPPLTTVAQRVDADQAVRYAAASGDHNPIHLDASVARSVGLPGVILHGLCTMAMTSHALLGALAGGDARRLRRLATRFSRPVLPGQELFTRVWPLPAAGRGDGATARYAYQTVNAVGEVVLKDGLAEIAPVG